MIAVPRRGVNRLHAVLTGLLLAGCHVGRPPGPTHGLSVGRVVAAVAEPALVEDLQQGLGRGLARRDGLGKGPAIDIEVLSATARLVGVDSSGVRVHRASLVVSYTRTGAAPRHVVLTGERSYSGGSTDSLATSGRRADAFSLLARDLGDQAAVWALTSPASSPSPERR